MTIDITLTDNGILLDVLQHLRRMQVTCRYCHLTELRKIVIDEDILGRKMLSRTNRCTRCHKHTLEIDRSNV